MMTTLFVGPYLRVDKIPAAHIVNNLKDERLSIVLKQPDTLFITNTDPATPFAEMEMTFDLHDDGIVRSLEHNKIASSIEGFSKEFKMVIEEYRKAGSQAEVHYGVLSLTN